MHRHYSLATLWVSCAMLSACSDAISSSPVGTLKYKNQLVSNVQVVFHLPSSRDGIALGITDSIGAFQLHTKTGEPTTLSPGKYHVTAQNTGEPTWAFPSKYLDPSKTPLLVEVIKGQTIEILIP